jgi:hypothetical protein
MPLIYLVQVKSTPDRTDSRNDGRTEADAQTAIIGYYTKIEDAIRCARSEAKGIYENAFEYTKPKESTGGDIYNVDMSFLSLSGVAKHHCYCRRKVAPREL